jgi:hypothetical protein
MASDSIFFNDITVEETISLETMRSRYYRARMEVVLKVWLNYQRVMQSFFASILASNTIPVRNILSELLDQAEQRLAVTTADLEAFRAQHGK